VWTACQQGAKKTDGSDTRREKVTLTALRSPLALFFPKRKKPPRPSAKLFNKFSCESSVEP